MQLWSSRKKVRRGALEKNSRICWGRAGTVTSSYMSWQVILWAKWRIWQTCSCRVMWSIKTTWTTCRRISGDWKMQMRTWGDKFRLTKTSISGQCSSITCRNKPYSNSFTKRSIGCHWLSTSSSKPISKIPTGPHTKTKISTELSKWWRHNWNELGLKTTKWGINTIWLSLNTKKLMPVSIESSK